jgi:hypothetical protein
MSARPSLVVTESEQELVTQAQLAVSQCNWVVGECAAKWTHKYAKGRTDADFAGKVGLSADEVFQRRRVCEKFGDIHHKYPALKWSHFYAALNWDDAADCFSWTLENEATVAEMKAWRRAIRGEDLSVEQPVDDFAGDPAVLYIPEELQAVRDPSGFLSGESRGARQPRSAAEAEERQAAVARQSDEGYTPFRKGAASPAPRDDSEDVAVAEKPRLSADQQLKRMTSTLERLNQALTASAVREMRKLPEKMRDRFVKAVAELSSKAAGLQ